jgi:hypothetical protein
MTSTSRVRVALVAAAVVAATAAVTSSTAAVKPALTLARGGTLTVTGTLVTADEGQNWTPTRCGATTPSQEAPLANTGQCDIIPVKLAMPKGLPADFRVGLVASVTFPQPAPVISMQVCEFLGSSESTYSCAGGTSEFKDPEVTYPLAASPTEKIVNIVVDQRVGYNNTYTLTVKWIDLTTITKLTLATTHVHGKSTLTATLTDEKKHPLKGQTIQFLAGTKPLGSAVTNAKGQAVLTGVKPGQSVKAVFPGTSSLTSATAQGKS